MKCGRNFFSKADFDAHLPCPGKREAEEETGKEKTRREPRKPKLPKTVDVPDESETADTGESDNGTINDG